MDAFPDFDGDTFLSSQDCIRLRGQMKRIYDLMRDGRWRTLRQIAATTNCLETSASTRLRDFRKPRFGCHEIQLRRVDGHPGLYEYRLVLSDSRMQQAAIASGERAMP